MACGKCVACQHRLALLSVHGKNLASLPTVQADIRALALMCLRGESPADYAPGGKRYIPGGWQR